MSEEPRPLGESLARLTDQLGAPSPGVLTAVFARWEEMVGESVATHAWPVSLSHGVLVIGVDQPAWATQLRYLGPDLMDRLSSVLPGDAVSRVEVKVLPKRPGKP